LYTPSLSEQDMIAILTDVQLIEAELTFKKNNQQDVSELTQTYYDQLFEHYGITDSIFSENVRYYTQHPAILETIMDSVTQRLTSSAPTPANH